MSNKFKKAKLKISALLGAVPYMVMFAGIIGSVVNADYAGILFTAWAIVNNLFNNLFKKLAKQFGSKKYGARPNPCGLKDGKECVGCGIFSSGRSKSWGMPSGHAQFSIWAATFATMWVVGKSKADEQKGEDLGWQLPVIWILALAVCIQRSPWISGCHSFLQILIGGIIGAGFGIGTYTLSTAISEERFPSAW